MSRFTLVVLLLFAFINCNRSNEPDIPEHIKQLDNLTVLASEGGRENTIHLEREMEFGSSDELIIGGLGSFDVDDAGRVYIGDTQQHRIYLFDKQGVYTASLGREGRGPGEFQYTGYLKIMDNLLFAFDPPQFRFHVFSTEDFELVKTMPFHVNNKRDFDELSEYTSGFWHPVSKNRFLVSFSYPVIYTDPSHSNFNVNNRNRLFYLIDDAGTILSDKIFEYPAYRALITRVNGEHRSTMFEFLGKTLLSIPNDSEMYVARSEEFLIKVYDTNGEYMRALYYPFRKKKFTREEAIHRQEHDYEGEEAVIEWRVSVIENAPEEQIPETWPALNDLLVDDENRIWVSTIFDDDEEYEWWVLDNGGTVLARFYWQVDEPIEVVKNGYMYTRETDEETGLQQIVRYRIKFEEG